MSEVLEQFRRIARARPQRLLLAEGGDERVVRAAAAIGRGGLADVAVVGIPDEVRGKPAAGRTSRRARCRWWTPARRTRSSAPPGRWPRRAATGWRPPIATATRATRCSRRGAGAARRADLFVAGATRPPPTCCARRCG